MSQDNKITSFLDHAAAEKTKQRTDELRDALIDAIAEHGIGMTVASVVGVLACVQHEIITEWAK